MTPERKAELKEIAERQLKHYKLGVCQPFQTIEPPEMLALLEEAPTGYVSVEYLQMRCKEYATERNIEAAHAYEFACQVDVLQAKLKKTEDKLRLAAMDNQVLLDAIKKNSP